MNEQLLLMTPGPTYVSEEVRAAIAKPLINPDIDPSFYDLYLETTQLLGKLMRTDNDVLILSGEGILGLEAACASLIEPGDRVLVLSNGIFGQGFGDFVKMYGGVPVYYTMDNRKPFDPHSLRLFLENDSNFKLATVVHCETPSGLINPIELLCPLLKVFNILTVVDAVSSIGGIAINTDEWGIDLLLGGSQKCLSAPPGLTFLSVSQDAWQAMGSRTTPICGFYANLTIWKNWYENKWFPYSQPVNDIYGLNTATKRVLEDSDFQSRHQRLAKTVRQRLMAIGFSLYPSAGYSDTVTAFEVPKDHLFDEATFRERLLVDHNLMITGAFGPLEGMVLRIGHMGENCTEDKVNYTLDAIEYEYNKIYAK